MTPPDDKPRGGAQSPPLVFSKPCTKCGVEKLSTEFPRNKRAPRGVHWWCKACAKAYQQANREKANEYSRRWCQTHPEQRRKRHANWRAKNRLKFNALIRKLRKKNQEKMRAYDRARYKYNSATAKAGSRRRAARMRGASGNVTAHEWADRLAEFNYHCAYCLKPLQMDGKRTPAEATQDHMTPISLGGPHHIDNLIPACRSCNASKQDRTLLDFCTLR